MRLQTPFEVITPTLDGPILNVLAGADAWFTAPRLTARLAKGSVEGVRRALARLVEVGIVERDTSSPVPLYRLNRVHLAAPAIIAIAAQRDELIARLRHEIAQWPDPASYAAIFGSAARGEMRTDSDIDLLLVRPMTAGKGWPDDVAALAAQASRWTGNDVRPLEYGELELKDAANEAVLREIAEEGITVYGERSWYRRQVGIA